MSVCVLALAASVTLAAQPNESVAVAPFINLSQQTSKVVIFGYSYRWIGGSRDNLKLVQPGEEVLAQVDDIRKQLLGGPCDALIDWAKQHGIAREPLQWTMEV